MDITVKRRLLRAVAITGGITALTCGFATAASAAPDASLPSVTRLSVASGPQAGGTTLSIVGTNLADACDETVDECEDGWHKPTVKFGDASVTAADVKAYSDKLVTVTVPSSSVSGKVAVTVTTPDTKVSAKNGTFSYAPTAPTVTKLEGSVTSEEGGKAVKITGTNFEYNATKATTKVSVGGKALKDFVVAADSKTITFDLAAGYVGPQDVVVTTSGGAVDAGVLEVTADVPKITSLDVATGSTKRATAVTITGDKLAGVKSAVLRDAEGKLKDVKLTVAAGATTSRVVVIVPKGAAQAGDIVLSTPYASSTPDDKSEFELYAAAAPKITTIADVALGATKLTVTGTDLTNIISVKVGTAVVKVEDIKTVTDGKSLELAVAATVTAKDVKLPVTVVTDGGTDAKDVTVGAGATTLTKAEYADKKVTLTGTGLKSLTAVTVKNGSKAVSGLTFTAKADGTSSEATSAADLAAGTYTVAGKDAAGKALSTTFTVAAPAPTLTKATYAAGKITLEGTTLGSLKDIVVTDPDDAVVSDVAFTAVADGKSSVATKALTRTGEYSVEGKDAGGKKVGPTAFTVKIVSTITAATGEVDGDSVALTGTNLDGLTDVTLKDDGGDPVALDESTGYAASDKGAKADLTLDEGGKLAAGEYTVSGKDDTGAIVTRKFTVTA